MEEFAFKVIVKKTKRIKSASITIDKNIVTIAVPKTLKNKRVKEIISKRKNWIEKKLKEQADKPNYNLINCVDNESLNYLGKKYILKVIQEKEESIKMAGRNLIATIPIVDKDSNKDIKNLLIKWYQLQAKRWLKKKTLLFSKSIGVKPESISIKNYRSRWGSCSGNSEISYNWKIILAPHNVIDYVVIHELCHLIEFNHSSLFWQNVGKYSSDWKECRNWLKENHKILNSL